MVPVMKTATITLKNVPIGLHESLKEQAKRHKRSLNMEAIQCLEAALAVSPGQRASLRNPPPLAKVGKILKPMGNRSDWQEEMYERG